MGYTIRSSYAEMPPQVISVNCDRRAGGIVRLETT